MKQPPLRRLLSLVLLLRGGRQYSAQVLARRFKVTLRTIYRDIATLQQAGIPIASTPGPGGGYSLQSDPELDPVLFASDSALAAFLTGGGLFGLKSAGRSTVVSRFLEQAQELLSPEDRELVRKSQERVYMDPQEWYWHDKFEPELQRFKDAVMQDWRLTISFYERDSGTPQSDVVDPYGLVWKGGFWYLVAYSKAEGRFRRYRLRRIVEASELGETFDRRADFDLVGYWRQDLESFAVGAITVVLRIEAAAVPEFENFGWKQENIIIRHPDHWDVEMHVDRFEWLIPLVLSYGGDVKVLQPEELQHRIVDEARRLIASHGSDLASTASTISGFQEPSDVKSRATRGRGLA